jgi:hypothetical protein
MTHIRVLGIDIAKQVFHVVGMDDTGNVVFGNACRAVHSCPLWPRCPQS